MGSEKQMPALILSSFDRLGGAAIAANRLHKALLGSGYPSRMLVARSLSTASETNEALGRLGGLWFRGMAILHRKLQARMGVDSQKFQPGWPMAPGMVSYTPEEILHAHWIADGFVSLDRLRRVRNPLVVTLHDMWHFTGGCHYDAGCGGYRDGCGSCPMLPENRHELARRGFRAKQRLASTKHPVVTSPSKWLADLARSSAIFSGMDVRVIPNVLDLDVFRPRSQAEARQVLGLPMEKKIIAFGALSTADPRKGWRHLQAALGRLGADRSDLLALVMGHSAPAGADSLGMEVRWTGGLTSEQTIASNLAAADVFVAPSEQENYPNTIAEALSCGIPCVGFRIGGIPEMIEDGRTGALADPFSPESLAEALRSCLNGGSKYRDDCTRFAMDNFGPETIRRYASLYEELSSRR